LMRNVKAFGRLAKFAPNAAGAVFTRADCAALIQLSLISVAQK
jgi:glutathione S-transferase